MQRFQNKIMYRIMMLDLIVRDQIWRGKPTRYAVTTTAVMGSMSSSTASGCTNSPSTPVTKETTELVRFDVGGTKGRLTGCACCTREGLETMINAWIAALAA
jgi:hypothetical protein